MFVDTHCHLDFDRFDEDRPAVVARAAAAGVHRIIVPAVNLDNCAAVLALAEKYPAVYAAVGVHPTSTAEWRSDWLDHLREFAQHERVVAIGEIGLDYYWDYAPAETQQRALEAQLELAAALDLPVIIHNRDASDDLIRFLSESPLNGRQNPGVLHSFSASAVTAGTALEMGFYLGFTGPVTFKKAEALRAVAAATPLDRLLIETDAPFLAPHPFRGKRNEPAYVVHTAERLAALHNLSLDRLAAQTTANAERLFALSAAK